MLLSERNKHLFRSPDLVYVGSGIELSGWQHRDPSGRLAGAGIVMVPCYELRAEGEAALGL